MFQKKQLNGLQEDPLQSHHYKSHGYTLYYNVQNQYRQICRVLHIPIHKSILEIYLYLHNTQTFTEQTVFRFMLLRKHQKQYLP